MNSHKARRRRQEEGVIPEEVTCESKAEDREELVVIVVEVERGREVPIVVCYGDDAEELASTFARKHKLSQQEALKLKENIQVNINKALQRYFPKTKSTPKLTSMQNYNKFLSKHNDAEKQRNKAKQVSKTKMNESVYEDKGTRMKNSQSILELPRRSKGHITPDIAISVQRLYSNAVNKRKEAEKASEMRKKEKELEEQQWSFKPVIDPLSKKLASQMHSRTETHLQSKSVSKKLARIKDSIQLEEKLSCPFKPAINKNSSKLADSRSQQTSTNLLRLVGSPSGKFEVLFEDARRRMLFQANSSRHAHNPACTFRPSINASQRVVGNGGKVKKAARKMETSVQLHKPKTGRPPKKGRNEENAPIGTYLYLQGRRKASLKSLAQKEVVEKECKSHNKSFVQEESNRLLENRKRSKIDSIFKELDQDFDGIITGRDASTESMSCFNI